MIYDLRTKTTSTGGGSGIDPGKLDGVDIDLQRVQLEVLYNEVYNTAYKEFSYNPVTGDLTQINVYTDSSKALHLFNKSFSYSSGNIISTTLTNKLNNKKLLKIFSYTDNNITSIQTTYS